MNSEEARKLLAALIFDDLDEASKTELMNYLQTDDELRERLADMRMAVKVASDTVQHGPDPVLGKQRLKRLARLARHHRTWPVVFTVRRLAAVAAAVVIIAVPCLIVLNQRDKAAAFALSGHREAYRQIRRGPSYVYRTPARESAGGKLRLMGGTTVEIDVAEQKSAASGQSGAETTFETGYAYAPPGQVPTAEVGLGVVADRSPFIDPSVLKGDSGGGIAGAPGGVLSGDVPLYAKDSPITKWNYNGVAVDAPDMEPYWSVGRGGYRGTDGPGVADAYGMGMMTPGTGGYGDYRSHGGMGGYGGGYAGYGGMGGYGMGGYGYGGYGGGGYGGYGRVRGYGGAVSGFDDYARMRGGADMQVEGETAGVGAHTYHIAGSSGVDVPVDNFIITDEDGDRRPVTVDDFGGVIAGTRPELAEPSKPVTDASGLYSQSGLTLGYTGSVPQSAATETTRKDALEQSLRQLGQHRDEAAVKYYAEPGLEAHGLASEKPEPPVPTYNENVQYGWKTMMSEKFKADGSKADISKEAKAAPTDGREVTSSGDLAEHFQEGLPSISTVETPLEKGQDIDSLVVSDRINNWSVNLDDKKEPVLVQTKPARPSIEAGDIISADPTAPAARPVSRGKDEQIPILGDVAIAGSLFRADKEEEALPPGLETKWKRERPKDDEAEVTEESARPELLTGADLGSRGSGRPAIDRTSVLGPGYRPVGGRSSDRNKREQALLEKDYFYSRSRLTDLDIGYRGRGSDVPAIDRSSVVGVEDETDLPPASRFKLVPVNPWVMTGRDRLSTFALDVDTASYALCRRYIRAGFLPPRGAVRMEEFINYFNYHYPRRTNPTFTVHAEAAPSPFASDGENLTLLKIGVKARTIGRDQRKAAHLIFVVDASASMGQPDRLPLVQQALGLLVDRLSPADRISLITCANEARLHLEASSARERDTIRNAIDAIQSSGPTNLLAGLKLGYAVARRSFAAKQINHVVLCSDGVANVGHTEAEAVLAEVAADRKQGITMTCVGVGYGSYNDVFLEALANRGDGSYVFLDSVREAERVFVKQLAATLHTVAKDARIQVDFNPHRVRRYRLIGYENRDIEDKRFRDDTIDAGEVGSGQCSTALYELELIGRPSVDRQEDLGTVFVRYRDVGTGQIEEISTRLKNAIVRRRTVENAPRFFLAAGAARFAEVLRESEHVQDGKLTDVLRIVEQVSRFLPLDRDVRELADLVRKAEHLPRAP